MDDDLYGDLGLEAPAASPQPTPAAKVEQPPAQKQVVQQGVIAINAANGTSNAASTAASTTAPTRTNPQWNPNRRAAPVLQQPVGAPASSTTVVPSSNVNTANTVNNPPEVSTSQMNVAPDAQNATTSSEQVTSLQLPQPTTAAALKSAADNNGNLERRSSAADSLAFKSGRSSAPGSPSHASQTVGPGKMEMQDIEMDLHNQRKRLNSKLRRLERDRFDKTSGVPRAKRRRRSSSVNSAKKKRKKSGDADVGEANKETPADEAKGNNESNADEKNLAENDENELSTSSEEDSEGSEFSTGEPLNNDEYSLPTNEAPDQCVRIRPGFSKALRISDFLLANPHIVAAAGKNKQKGTKGGGKGGKFGAEQEPNFRERLHDIRVAKPPVLPAGGGSQEHCVMIANLLSTTNETTIRKKIQEVLVSEQNKFEKENKDKDTATASAPALASTSALTNQIRFLRFLEHPRTGISFGIVVLEFATEDAAKLILTSQLCAESLAATTNLNSSSGQLKAKPMITALKAEEYALMTATNETDGGAGAGAVSWLTGGACSLALRSALESRLFGKAITTMIQQQDETNREKVLDNQLAKHRSQHGSSGGQGGQQASQQHKKQYGHTRNQQQYKQNISPAKPDRQKIVPTNLADLVNRRQQVVTEKTTSTESATSTLPTAVTVPATNSAAASTTASNVQQQSSQQQATRATSHPATSAAAQQPAAPAKNYNVTVFGVDNYDYNYGYNSSGQYGSGNQAGSTAQQYSSFNSAGTSSNSKGGASSATSGSGAWVPPGAGGGSSSGGYNQSGNKGGGGKRAPFVPTNLKDLVNKRQK